MPRPLACRTRTPQRASRAGCVCAVLYFLSACTTPPPPPAAPPAPKAQTPAPVVVLSPPAPEPLKGPVSLARSEREYRKDAAAHLYQLNQPRIYKGRMPPLLQAVAVMDVVVDKQGQVRAIEWRRAPRHVPEVMREMERTVRNAAPFPAPQYLEQVTYTETWLWHKSGLFQLDTLTEGQN